MTITLVQHDIKWNDATANMHTVAGMLKGLETDLIILPEMWNTGFITDPHNTKTADFRESLGFMQEQASKINGAIIGSMTTDENGRFYNRLYFVRPDGSYDTYDKRHLFSYAGEDKHYTPGTKPLVVEWRGVRIMLQVCYDLRFPVFSRNRMITRSSSLDHEPSTINHKPLYDVCVYIASWPESRRRVWDTLLQARAIENQCYVVGVNRIGDDPSSQSSGASGTTSSGQVTCHYNGGTQLVDAYGKVVAMVEDNRPSIITETLDIERLNRFRKKFPVLEDAD